MRSDGLWHPRLLADIARIGHGQTLVVADPGLPVPPGVATVDLVWAADQPRFLPVLGAVVRELVVEAAMVADELTDEEVVSGIAEVLGTVPTARVRHEELKRRLVDATVVVRTGETTPYANVILTAGVPF